MKRIFTLALMLCLFALQPALAAPNTSPIYTTTPHVEWNNGLATANTAMDGTGTVATVFTATTNGSYAQDIRIKALGTNVATVIRVFVNNGSTNATAANNTLVAELSIAATTASNSTSLPDLSIPINRTLPNGYKLNVAIGTTVSAGLCVTTFGGDY